MTRPQVNDLRRQLEGLDCRRRGAIQRGAETASPRDSISSGWNAIDQLLPWGGFPRGSLVEWLGAAGSGVGLLALVAAQAAKQPGIPLVVVDPWRQFYPPAAAAWGLSGDNLLLVHPANHQDTLWVLDQALRSPGVAAVWGLVEELAPRPFRRLQLAAEEGGGWGHLVRPLRVRGQPSWGDVQLVVQPLASGTPLLGRRWRIELTRYRGMTSGGFRQGVVELEVNEQGQEVVRTSQESVCHVSNSLPLVS